MTGPFRFYVRVRYGECDAQKVVFNSRYAEYVDVGVNEFLRAAGVLDQFVYGHLDFQLVKQTVEWKAPARFDQVLELSIAAKHLGNTSFTLTTEFRVVREAGTSGVPEMPGMAGIPGINADSDRAIVTVETVYVLVDAQTLSKLPLPENIRAALADGARDKATDHAACHTINAAAVEGA